MFWNNVEELLTAGPTGIAGRVAALLQSTQHQHAVPADAPTGAQDPVLQHALVGMSPPSDASRQVRIATDAHHLKPRGCGTAHQHMHEVATGVCFCVLQKSGQ